MKFKLLIVDDEEDIKAVLQDRLESYGFEVTGWRFHMPKQEKSWPPSSLLPSWPLPVVSLTGRSWGLSTDLWAMPI
ncbi:MAG: hypothetical protein ACREQ7_24760 [Candidatus Binatia bacterium]